MSYASICVIEECFSEFFHQRYCT